MVVLSLIATVILVCYTHSTPSGVEDMIQMNSLLQKCVVFAMVAKLELKMMMMIKVMISHHLFKI